MLGQIAMTWLRWLGRVSVDARRLWSRAQAHGKYCAILWNGVIFLLAAALLVRAQWHDAHDASVRPAPAICMATSACVLVFASLVERSCTPNCLGNARSCAAVLWRNTISTVCGQPPR